MEQIKYKEGDVLADRNGNEHTVLAALGMVALLSDWDDPNAAGEWWTQCELDEAGYALKDPKAELIEAEEALAEAKAKVEALKGGE